VISDSCDNGKNIPHMGTPPGAEAQDHSSSICGMTEVMP